MNVVAYTERRGGDPLAAPPTELNPVGEFQMINVGDFRMIIDTGEYVRGKVHTNNIESFWSLLKRGIVGSFHNASKDYLPLYLAEFSFRHNNTQESGHLCRVAFALLAD